MFKNLQLIAVIIIWSVLIGFVPRSASAYVNRIESHNGSTIILTHIPDRFHDTTAKQWRSIGRYIVDSTHKTYILHWQGTGGNTLYGREFINYIQAARAQGKQIIIQMTGDSYSMHTLVTCYATRVTNESNYFNMWHADGYIGSKTRLTRQRSSITQFLNQCLFVRAITTKELDTMWLGYEVYKNNLATWYIRDTRPIN